MGTRDRDKTNDSGCICTCTDKIDGMLRCTAMAKIFWELKKRVFLGWDGLSVSVL